MQETGIINKFVGIRTGLVEELLGPGISDSRPPDWELLTIEDLLAPTESAMRSGPFGSSLLASEYVDDGVPLLGIDNVYRDHFIDSYRRYITPQRARALRRYRVFPRDIMITVMGTVGRCCVIPDTVGHALSSKHVWTITMDADLYLPELACVQINYQFMGAQPFCST